MTTTMMVIEIAALFFSILAFILANVSIIMVLAFKNSTHRIEWRKEPDLFDVNEDYFVQKAKEREEAFVQPAKTRYDDQDEHWEAHNRAIREQTFSKEYDKRVREDMDDLI